MAVTFDFGSLIFIKDPAVQHSDAVTIPDGIGWVVTVETTVIALTGTGSPSLTVTVEQSNDGSNWAAYGGGAAISVAPEWQRATTSNAIRDRMFRLVYTFAGTAGDRVLFAARATVTQT